MHGDMLFTIDGKEILINEHTEEGSARVDGVLVYESEFLPFKNYTITFSQHVEDCVLNCFYYYPLPSPEPEPENWVLDDDNCNKNKRCEKKVTNVKENIQVYVEVSNFNGFTNDGNGGAIYIENAALKVNKSDFKKCESTNGGGGAIYIKNTFEISNTYYLQDIEFNGNTALYGGAVYIHATSLKVNASIGFCQFIGNQATEKSSNSNKLYGGSAIYLSISYANIYECNFKDNKGYGGTLKYIDISDNKQTKSSEPSLQSYVISLVKVHDCRFEIGKSEDCSLFYEQTRKGPRFELINCRFAGSLSKNSHYIDGLSDSKNSQKMIVESCTFAAEFNRAFNVEGNNNLKYVDQKSQVFEKSENEGKLWKIIYTIALPVVGVVAVIAIVAAVIVSRKIEKKEPLDTQIPAEVKDSLL